MSEAVVFVAALRFMLIDSGWIEAREPIPASLCLRGCGAQRLGHMFTACSTDTWE